MATPQLNAFTSHFVMDAVNTAPALDIYKKAASLFAAFNVLTCLPARTLLNLYQQAVV